MAIVVQLTAGEKKRNKKEVVAGSVKVVMREREKEVMWGVRSNSEITLHERGVQIL